MEKITHCASPIGPLTIAEEAGAITRIHWGLPKTEMAEPTPLLQAAVRQLTEYFAGRRRVFDLPLAPQGTPFQRSTWAALQRIPFGETRTYGEIARAMGRPKACRAVGMANHHNPIPIVIPCHRVIGSQGRLVGYAGGMDIKRFLLELEGVRLPL